MTEEQALQVIEHTSNRIKDVFEPRFDALDGKLDSLNQQIADHGNRIEQLESNSKKALIGWGVFATGFAAIFSTILQKFRDKIGL